MNLPEVVNRVLRNGAIVSTSLMGIGLALTLLGWSPAWGDGLLRTGLLILIATPVANVVLSGLEWFVERDWRFFVLTVAVLVILSCSLAVALAHLG